MVIVTALLSLTVVGPAKSTSADVLTNEPRLVELDGVFVGDDPPTIGAFTISQNARYATVSADGSWYHVVLATGATTKLAIDKAVATNDPNLVRGGIFDRERLRHDPATEVVGSMEAVLDPIVTIEIGLDPAEWGPAIARNRTPDGRYLLLEAETVRGRLTNWYLYDTVTDELMTPITGLPTHTPTHWPHEVTFGGGGSFIDYYARPAFGSTYLSHERFYYLTGEHVSIPRPHPESSWALSPDRTWTVFFTSAADVISGLDASPRLYRRHLESGQTSVVPWQPADPFRHNGYAVYDDGSVIYRHSYADPERPDEHPRDQLYVWNGVGPVRMATVGIDGRPADSGIEAVELSATGPTALFTSWSSNLVEGVPAFGEPGYRGRLLYIQDGFIPSPDAPVGGPPAPAPPPIPAPAPPVVPSPPNDDPDPDSIAPPGPAELAVIGSAAGVQRPAARCSRSTRC